MPAARSSATAGGTAVAAAPVGDAVSAALPSSWAGIGALLSTVTERLPPVTPSAPVVTSRPDRDGRDSHGPDAGPHLVERLEHPALAPSALPPCRTIAVWTESHPDVIADPQHTVQFGARRPCRPCGADSPGAARPARRGRGRRPDGLAAVS
jgi:hypothetical protein